MYLRRILRLSACPTLLLDEVTDAWRKVHTDSLQPTLKAQSNFVAKLRRWQELMILDDFLKEAVTQDDIVQKLRNKFLLIFLKL